MAQNINSWTQGTVEEEEERDREETYAQLQELSVSERVRKTCKCEICVSKGQYESMAVFLCFACEMYICAGCMDGHRWHKGMEEEIKEGETEKERRLQELRTNRKKFLKTAESEREIMLEKFIEQLLNESNTERKKELKKTSQVSVCDRVNVKHELDRNDCRITGLCGLENRRWVVCDRSNSCIKIFKLGSHELQRYIRFVGSRPEPWDVTEIDLKQNSAELSLVSCSSSGISGTDRADPDKQCLIAVTLPWILRIIFIDLSKNPAKIQKIIKTEGQCFSIQFSDNKIFTVCFEDRSSPCSVYMKSTDGLTINKFKTDIYRYIPYLAVISGRVYLTDRYNDKVQRRNVEGQVLTDIAIEGMWPFGTSVDPDNNVYVCSRRHSKVYKLDADLTRYGSVIDQNADNIELPESLCYYRSKLFIAHEWSSSFGNFVTVVRFL